MKWQSVSTPRVLLAASLRKKLQDLLVLARNPIAVFILFAADTVLISLTAVIICSALTVAWLWLTFITLIYLFDMQPKGV